MAVFYYVEEHKMSTNVKEFIEDLDVGNLNKKLSVALSEVGIGVMRSEGETKGKVILEFEISMLSADKVNVKHKLTFKKPTARGMQSEEDTTVTPMYISRDGSLSLLPKNSYYDKDSSVIEHQQ